VTNTSVLIVLFAAAASLLRAHELDIAATVTGSAVIVRSAYAGTDPVPFAKIQIFSPDGQEFQSANTDKHGYFAFVPDAAGSWRVLVDDELGHKRELSVAFRGGSAPSDPAPQSSRMERAILGIAVLFGVTGFWYGYRASLAAKIRSQIRP
jgi:nickel transport protein